MRKVTFANGKGGCAKSVTCINLACVAIAADVKAAIVDMDIEQGTCLKWLSRRNGKAHPIVRRAEINTLDTVLDELKAGGVQWTFLDLPGRATAITSAGIKAADFVVVSCRPLDIDIESSLTTVQAAKNTHRPYAYLMNIAPGQHDRRRARQVQGFLRAHGHQVVDTIITQRIIVPDAIADGFGINESKPDSESAAEYADLFRWLDREVKSQ